MTTNQPRILQVSGHESYMIVTFRDGLDAVSFDANDPLLLREELRAVAEQSAGRSVIVDIECQWSNVWAAMYNNFASLHRQLGKTLLFCNLSESATEIFHMNQLETFLNIFSTREAAIASIDLG